MARAKKIEGLSVSWERRGAYPIRFAEDAFAEGDALEALGFCLLPFFVTDAAFWADENGNLFCLRQR